MLYPMPKCVLGYDAYTHGTMWLRHARCLHLHHHWVTRCGYRVLGLGIMYLFVPVFEVDLLSWLAFH